MTKISNQVVNGSVFYNRSGSATERFELQRVGFLWRLNAGRVVVARTSNPEMQEVEIDPVHMQLGFGGRELSASPAARELLKAARLVVVDNSET